MHYTVFDLKNERIAVWLSLCIMLCIGIGKSVKNLLTLIVILTAILSFCVFTQEEIYDTLL